MTSATKYNFLTVFSLFGLLVVWWLGLNFGLLPNNPETRLFWSTCGQIILIVAVYCGYIFCIDKQENNQSTKKIVGIFTVGALSQLIALILFAYYSITSKDESPYLTPADLFYGVISLCDVVIALFISKKYFKSLRFWLVLLPIVTIISLLSVWGLKVTNYVLSWELEAMADIYYISMEGLATSLGFAALVLSRGFYKNKYRSAYILMVFAFLLQFLADSYFVNTNRINTWVNGAFGDLLYLCAYFFTTSSLFLFIKKSITVEISLLFLNSFLIAQFVLSSDTTNSASNLLIVIIGVGVSAVLWKRNKKEIRDRENEIMLQSLLESNAKLLELDQQKTEFLNIAAHQLRTPVSIIRNYVAMMQDGDFGEVPEQIKEVHGHIYQSNQWLVRLADEFLNLSKLESGQLKYHLESADLARAVDEVVAEIKPKADKKGLTLEIIRPNEPIMALIDIEKIKHATMNLVENAVKYTPEGSIIVKVETAGDGVTVTVTDTGIGIPPDDLPNLFQKFRRGKNAHEIEVNTSTGLGLYIARKFIEGHGGKIWVKSEGELKGGEFGFLLIR